MDGQQRLRAIFEFQAGDFGLPKDSDPIDGINPGRLKYADLPDELRLRFDTYSLDVIWYQETLTKKKCEKCFFVCKMEQHLRRRKGETRCPGKMREFVKSLATHAFFERCGFANARFNFVLVAAQMTAIELNGGPCHLRNSNLTMGRDTARF